MKKRIAIIAAVVASIMGASIAIHVSKNETELLLSENMEILAEMENPNGKCAAYCKPRKNIQCHVTFDNGNEKFCYNYDKR